MADDWKYSAIFASSRRAIDTPEELTSSIPPSVPELFEVDQPTDKYASRLFVGRPADGGLCIVTLDFAPDGRITGSGACGTGPALMEAVSNVPQPGQPQLYDMVVVAPDGYNEVRLDGRAVGNISGNIAVLRQVPTGKFEAVGRERKPLAIADTTGRRIIEIDRAPPTHRWSTDMTMRAAHPCVSALAGEARAAWTARGDRLKATAPPAVPHARGGGAAALTFGQATNGPPRSIAPTAGE